MNGTGTHVMAKGRSWKQNPNLAVPTQPCHISTRDYSNCKLSQRLAIRQQIHINARAMVFSFDGESLEVWSQITSRTLYVAIMGPPVNFKRQKDHSGTPLHQMDLQTL